MICHLQKENYKEISLKCLGDIYSKAPKLLNKLNPVLDAWVSQRCMHMPQLFCKDHKLPEYNGSYTSKMLTPATSFTQCFGNIGYKAVKAVFNKN